MRNLLALSLTLLVLAAAAIEPPQAPPGAPSKPAPEQQEPPAPAPKAEPPPQEAEPGAPEAAEDDEELPPLPPEDAAAGPSPQRFNPTEKVRADFPVSFPIDI